MIEDPMLPTALVVGFDGGVEDIRVCETAVDVARELRVRLEVVHAADMASGDDAAAAREVQVAHDKMAAIVRERVAAAQTRLDALLKDLQARGGGSVEVRTRMVEGHPFEALLQAAEGERAWIVVGARRSRSVLARTVDLVLRRATHPVLVVPDGASWRAGSLIAGIDAGELDERVLRMGERLARSLQRRLGIVHVRTHSDESTMLRVTEHVREVAPWVSANATLSVMRVEHSIATTLAEHARRADAALVIVGTHGKRALERWVLGSTAESLAHLCTLPFLVVR